MNSAGHDDRILLFIPCYNCAPQIGRVLSQVNGPVASRIAEVLVLDNGSSDGTVDAAIAAAPQVAAPQLTIARNHKNYNLGGSHKAAYRYASRNGFTHVVTLHGDDQGDLRDLLPTLDAGNLKSKYDVLIFVDGGIPSGGGGRRGGGGGGFGEGMPTAENIPAEYRAQLGRVSTARTLPQLKQFLEDGGTILAIGSSTSLIEHLNLPLTSALVEHTTDGDRALPQEKFYVPGSLLKVSVDNTNPLAYGMESAATVFFDHSPAFRLQPDAPQKGVKTVAWYPTASPLQSGWAWGQHYLQNAVAIADANVGKGKVFLFGPEINFRDQPHGTFKLLFNGIYYGQVDQH